MEHLQTGLIENGVDLRERVSSADLLEAGWTAAVGIAVCADCHGAQSHLRGSTEKFHRNCRKMASDGMVSAFSCLPPASEALDLDEISMS